MLSREISNWKKNPKGLQVGQSKIVWIFKSKMSFTGQQQIWWHTSTTNIEEGKIKQDHV